MTVKRQCYRLGVKKGVAFLLGKNYFNLGGKQTHKSRLQSRHKSKMGKYNMRRSPTIKNRNK